MRSMNVSNATESLQGKVAGVTIVGAGNPGGQPKVLIRGSLPSTCPLTHCMWLMGFLWAKESISLILMRLRALKS